MKIVPTPGGTIGWGRQKLGGNIGRLGGDDQKRVGTLGGDDKNRVGTEQAQIKICRIDSQSFKALSMD